MKKYLLVLCALLSMAPVWAESTYSRGDVNGDGIVDVSDVSDFVDNLLNGGESIGDSDINQDGIVDVNDIADLLDYLLYGTWPAGIQTIQMAMQGGMLNNGLTKGIITQTSQFMNYCHTVLLLDISNCTIESVATETDETLTIACLDEDRNFLSDVNSFTNIPASTKYVRFQVKKSSAYESVRTLSVTVNGTPLVTKNDVPAKVSAQFFSFETALPNHEERVWDNGHVKLPPNYSVNGDPVPLIVFVHGTNGFHFNTQSAGNYSIYQDFLVNNGYALCDCSGLTNVYSAGADAFASPSFLTSIASMIKYLTANYNISNDGVYIYSKSSGGFTCLLLSQKQYPGINVKCAGVLAPSITLMLSTPLHITQRPRAVNTEATQIGITYEYKSPFGEYPENKENILENMDKWSGIDPFFVGSDMTVDEYRSAISAVYDNTSNIGTPSVNVVNICNTAAAKAIVDASSRQVIVPTKIWVAVDDITISVTSCQAFVDMASRGNSPCCLIRKMAAGHGRHHAVDTDSKAEKADYPTAYGGTPVDVPTGLQVPIAYIELLEWFKEH